MCLRVNLIAFVLLAVSWTPILKAQVGPYCYRTLEERILNSETVILAKITEITGQRQQLGQETFKTAFEIERVFKGHGQRMNGHQQNKSDHYFYLLAQREAIEGWIESEARLVVCAPDHHTLISENARIVVNLSETNLQCLSLSDDGELRALTQENDILKAISHTAQKLPGVTRVRTFQMMAEEKLVKEADLQVRDGFPIAFVPVDKPLETWAKRKIASGEPWTINSAIRALLNFPSDANADWVRKEIDKRKPSSEQMALKKLLIDWDLSDN